MSKVYIACHHPDPANVLAARLLAANHTIASSWHRDTAPRPSPDDAAAWTANAARNMKEIGNTDVLVVIASTEHVAGTARVPGGKFVEFGYALGRCVRVFTLGGVENGMLHHPNVEHAAGVDELLAMLGNR